MPRPISTLAISVVQKSELIRMRRNRTTGKLVARRIEMILMRGSGASQVAVARHLKVNRPVVSHWEKRFRGLGLAGLLDAEGRGRKPSLSTEKRALIENGQSPTAVGENRWTVRRMAEHAGVAIGTVHAIWKAKRVLPKVQQPAEIVGTKAKWKLGWRVVGLYLRPPMKVLAIIEFDSGDKSLFLPGSSNMWDRRQPRVPERNLASFLSALSYIERRIFSQLAPRSDERAFRDFLRGVVRIKGNVKYTLLSNKALPDFGLMACEENAAVRCSWMEHVDSFLREMVEGAYGRTLSSAVSEIVLEMEKWVERAGCESQSFCWLKEFSGNAQ